MWVGYVGAVAGVWLLNFLCVRVGRCSGWLELLCGVFCSVVGEVAFREVRAGIAAKGEGRRSSVRPVSCSCSCAFGFGGCVQ